MKMKSFSTCLMLLALLSANGFCQTGNPGQTGVLLKMKASLQGAMIGSAGSLMRDDLRVKGLLPFAEPYSGISNFEHAGNGGGETVTDSSIFQVSGPNAIVDWVFIELRDSSAIDVGVATKAALLQRDGDVVEADGSADLNFGEVDPGKYYVAVKHRNHLGLMTAEPMQLDTQASLIDFSNPDFEVLCQSLEINNIRMMWAGDLNHDGRSIYYGPNNDIAALFLAVLKDPGNVSLSANFVSAGYLNADLDLNGLAIYSGPGNDRVLMVTEIIVPWYWAHLPIVCDLGLILFECVP